MTKAIVVVGAGRSHTSLVAGGLRAMGVPVGRELLGAAESNPDGHFEDIIAVAINNTILREAGGEWDDPPLPEAIEAVVDMFAEVVSDYVAMRSEADVWAVKDPRFAITWPVWEPHMPDDTTVVVCWRRPWYAAESLNVRDKRDDGDEVTTLYHERMLSHETWLEDRCMMQ